MRRSHIRQSWLQFGLIFSLLVLLNRGLLAQQPLGTLTYGELTISVIATDGSDLRTNGEVTLYEGGPNNYPGGSVVDWYYPYNGTTLRGFSWSTDPLDGTSYGKHIDRWGEEGQTYANSQIGYAKYKVRVHYTGTYHGVDYNFDRDIYVDWRDADYRVSGAYQDEDLMVKFTLSDGSSGSWSYTAHGDHSISEHSTVEIWNSFMKASGGRDSRTVPIKVTCPSGYVFLRQGTSGGQAYASPYLVRLTAENQYQFAAYNNSTGEIGELVTLAPDFAQFGQKYLFPSEPSSLTASSNPGDYRIRLSWTASQGTGLTYEVWSDFHNDNGTYVREWRLLGTTSNIYYVDQEWIYEPGGNHGINYRVRAKNSDGFFSTYAHRYVSGDDPNKIAVQPLLYALDQNFPNPFNPKTTINFTLAEPSKVSLVVQDLLGREVTRLAEGFLSEGNHSVTWNATNVASGTYYLKLRVVDELGNSKYSKTRKILVTK